MHKTAIVYHYLALYRLPIFTELMKSDLVEFTLYSGTASDIEIKKIDTDLSKYNLTEGGLRWFFLKNNWLFKKKILWQSGLISLMIKSEYDSVIFLGSPYHISTWLAAIIARLRGIKVFYWMHGVYKNKLTFIDYFKLFVFYKIADGFFLYGKRAFEVLNRYKIKNNNNIHIVYNSLDYIKSIQYRKTISKIEIYKYREKYFKDKHMPVVVFIGRLNKIKRLDMLIEAQKLLEIKYGKCLFNILIIGDGEEKNNLQQLGIKNGLAKNISFLGAIYDEEINSNALMYADLCVTPGEVGLTAIHSLSYGTPVISHNNLDTQMPEIESILQGFNGDLYQYKNINDLAQVIEKWLLSNPIKNQLIMNNCYHMVDKYYNPNFQLKTFENILVNTKNK